MMLEFCYNYVLRIIKGGEGETKYLFWNFSVQHFTPIADNMLIIEFEMTELN